MSCTTENIADVPCGNTAALGSDQYLLMQGTQSCLADSFWQELGPLLARALRKGEIRGQLDDMALSAAFSPDGLADSGRP